MNTSENKKSSLTYYPLFQIYINQQRKVYNLIQTNNRPVYPKTTPSPWRRAGGGGSLKFFYKIRLSFCLRLQESESKSTQKIFSFLKWEILILEFLSNYLGPRSKNKLHPILPWGSRGQKNKISRLTKEKTGQKHLF